MKRNLFAISLSVMLVVALMFVVAPSAKADSDVVQATADGELAVETGKILDLNGFNVTVTVAEGETLRVIDTANDTKDGTTNAGTLTNEGAGSVAVTAQDPSSKMRYVAIATTVNDVTTYQFHPFNLTFSQVGINTISGENRDQVAICLRGTYFGNDKALGVITDYGICPIEEDVLGEPISAKKNYSFNGNNLMHAYFDLSGSLSADSIDKTINYCAYMVVNGETVYSSSAVNTTPREVLKKINKDNVTPTDTQKAAIENLIAKSSYLKNLFTSITGAACEHQGGTATCTALAVCIDCDEDYGALSAHSYTTTTIKAGVGSDYGYDRLDCSACGHSETTNWTRHILDKALTDKEIAALAALTPESWNGNGNLNGAGQWFYKAAGVDISSVLTKTVYSTMTTLFTSGSSETKLWPIAGNTTDFAKMMVTNYYGGSAAYKHAQFVPEDFQIGDIFSAKGICKTCGNAHYMVALYQGNGRFLSVSNCGGGSKCEVTCAYDETTVFAENFFAQTDVATWNYYFVLRPNMLTQIRDMSASALTDAEKEIISNLTAADVSSGYGNLNGFANEVYKLAGVDTSAYINKTSYHAHTAAFATESNWTKMLLPNSWGGTNHSEDEWDLSTYAFEVGDIISGKMTPTGGSATYVTAIYQGEDNFLVQNTTAGTVSVMTLADIFAEGNAWEYYFAMRPDQLVSAE